VFCPAHPLAGHARHHRAELIFKRRYHLTLLAKDNTGYRNLSRLITARIKTASAMNRNYRLNFYRNMPPV